MPRLIAAILIAAAPIPAARAQQIRTPEAQTFVGLLVGQQILRACDAGLDADDQRRLDAAIADRRAAQSEIAAPEVATMTGRLYDSLRAPANQAKICGQLKEIGPHNYVETLLAQSR